MTGQCYEEACIAADGTLIIRDPSPWRSSIHAVHDEMLAGSDGKARRSLTNSALRYDIGGWE